MSFRCGGIAYADGIDVGVGFCYEPLHCDCGWSEMCSYEDKEEFDEWEYKK
ncbi:hypothetical protein KLN27_15210 [Clostridioides difficile]|uniref:hypothetical protein n=1 Tax=Clostridioides difficile TaxID=1496 RepID=UPI001025D5FB|nr:hypothetical protein [Clostridioides difficile]MCO5908819.1 hypothetical protein [Clostridioides difficile]MDO0221593.1 hypothetical protein [Clostridioides difficile]VFF10410.1 Uncharacterised protein [Clostridioides difficile]HAT4871051.1 hypothetical protein [Clostridioides difficile]HBF9019390.1 hypothetical protein [Clostridioides difficile]